MAAFSASDIAFEGFRITRERPLAVLAWAGLLLALQIATTAVMLAVAGPAMADLQSAAAGGTGGDPSAILAAYGRMAPALSLIWPFTLLVSAVISCAVYRMVLRPQESALAGMRIGADELRVLVVSVAIVLLISVVVFVGIILAGVVGGGVAAAANGPAGAILGGVIGIAVLCAVIFMSVRLSLAAPMTFEQRDFRVFESWRATQGTFWPLFGAYLLAFILGLLVSLLLAVVFAAIGGGLLLASGQSLTEAFSGASTPTSLAALLGPAALIYAVFNAFTSAVFTTILYAPAAAAWRQLSGPEKVFA